MQIVKHSNLHLCYQQIVLINTSLETNHIFYQRLTLKIIISFAASLQPKIQKKYTRKDQFQIQKRKKQLEKNSKQKCLIKQLTPCLDKQLN